MTHQKTQACPYRAFGIMAAKAPGALLALALVAHVSWNMAAPDLFGLPEIGLNQALGLVGIGLVAAALVRHALGGRARD